MVEIRLKTKNTSCEFDLDFNEVKIPVDINILKDLEKDIENSIYHLKRSNEEIKEFDPLGEDNDLFLALNENKFALGRKEQRLKLIKEKIQNLESIYNLNEVSVCNDTLTSKNNKIETRGLIENEHSSNEENYVFRNVKLRNDNLRNDNLCNNVNQNNLNSNDFKSMIKNESKKNFHKNSSVEHKNGIYL